MENLEQYLKSRDKKCRKQLDDDILYERIEIRNEAKVLKQAIEQVFKPKRYNYLIAYEYENPSVYKGDAILAKYYSNGTMDIIALEAKYVNYDNAIWRNQKRKVTTLKTQIGDRLERWAIHYLTEILSFDRSLIDEISRIGVYNGSMGEIKQLHPNDPESDEEETFPSYEYPSQETVLQPATQPVTQEEGFPWGKALGALALGGALYMASASQQEQQQQTVRTNRNNRNTQAAANQENEENCLLM